MTLSRKATTTPISTAIRTAVALVVAAVAASTPAGACTVCFGEADGPMIDGARMGVYLLFGLTLVVQGAFAAFFITLYRRSRDAAHREQVKAGLRVVKRSS